MIAFKDVTNVLIVDVWKIGAAPGSNSLVWHPQDRSAVRWRGPGELHAGAFSIWWFHLSRRAGTVTPTVRFALLLQELSFSLVSCVRNQCLCESLLGRWWPNHSCWWSALCIHCGALCSCFLEQQWNCHSVKWARLLSLHRVPDRLREAHRAQRLPARQNLPRWPGCVWGGRAVYLLLARWHHARYGISRRQKWKAGFFSF